jgi:hypothetical protein
MKFLVAWIKLQAHCLFHFHRQFSVSNGKLLFGRIYIPLIPVYFSCHDCKKVYYKKGGPNEICG